VKYAELSNIEHFEDEIIIEDQEEVLSPKVKDDNFTDVVAET